MEAYKDLAKLFTTHKDQVFPPDVGPADVLWAWKIGEETEKAIDDYKA